MSDAVLIVPAIPAEVYPGDVVDYPVPIVGFEPIEEERASSKKKTAVTEGPVQGEGAER